MKALVLELDTIKIEIDNLKSQTEDSTVSDSQETEEDTTHVNDSVEPGSVVDPTLQEKDNKTIIDQEIDEQKLKEQQLIKDYWRIHSKFGERHANAFWTSKTQKPLP